MSDMPTQPALTPLEPPLLDRLVAAHRDRPGALLTILEQLQQADPHNHLPAAVVQQVARALGVPPSQIYSVVTFYSFFNLRPQGRHSVAICRGTACHTRGSRNLLDAVTASLTFAPDQGRDGERSSMTTADNQFTVRAVACFGHCALAPVVELDRHIHGQVHRQSLLQRIERLSAKGGRS